MATPEQPSIYYIVRGLNHMDEYPLQVKHGIHEILDISYYAGSPYTQSTPALPGRGHSNKTCIVETPGSSADQAKGVYNKKQMTKNEQAYEFFANRIDKKKLRPESSRPLSSLEYPNIQSLIKGMKPCQ